MHTYPGANPVTIISTGTGSPGVIVSPNQGTFSLPQVVDGGDARSAANLMAGVEANRDAINWTAWRTVDWIAGGNYSLDFVGSVTLGNQITLIWDEASSAFIVTSGGNAIAATSNGNFAALIANASGSAAAVLANNTGANGGNGVNGFGGACVGLYTGVGVAGFGGAGNGDGLNGTPSGTGAAVRSFGPLVRQGTTGWEQNRKTSVSAANSSFAAQAYDTVWCYNTGGSAYTIQLTNPNTAGVPEGVRVRFVAPGYGGAGSGSSTGPQAYNVSGVTIQDVNGLVFGVLGPTAGSVKSVLLETISVSGVIHWDLVEFTTMT